MDQNDTNFNEGFSSKETSQALRSLKSLSVAPSPYLKTRVMAQVMSQLNEKEQLKQNFFKKYLMRSVLASAFVVAISFFVFNVTSKQSKNNSAVVASHKLGETYVIRMDIRPLKDSAIAYAEVVLPDENIQFSSSKHSEVSSQRKVVISWDMLVEKQFLPIIVKGIKAGPTQVVVNFYGADNKLIKSQSMDLNFKGG